MDDNTFFSADTTLRSASLWRLAGAAALTLALASCGGSDVPDALADADADSALPSSVVFAASTVDSQASDGGELGSGEAVSVTGTVPDTTVAVTTTTTAPSTTTAPTTTTTVAPPVVLTPAEVAGAYEDERSDQRVLTAVNDPLNVRTGPGVQFAIVDTIEHETSGIDVTHSVNIDEDVAWRYVEVDGEPLGWVHARYVFGHGVTSTCLAAADFPTFEGAAIAGSGDVDLDGQSDQIFVLVESSQVGTSHAGYPVFEHTAWVLVSFANGGVATGQWDGYFEPVPTASINVFDLTTLNPADDFNEVVFTLGTGASHAQWGVMTLDGCEMVTTTLEGGAFSFSHGASAGHSTVGGCAYGPHGEIEFQTSSRNFNTGAWSNLTYQLVGTEWLYLGTQQGIATANDDFPYAPMLTDCVGFGQ